MAARDDQIHSLRTLRATRRRRVSVRDQVMTVWRARGQAFDLPERIAVDSPVHAEINPVQHMRPDNWIARWIVRCPECGGAEDADLEEPLFFCLSCYNDAVAGNWRPVVFPDDREQLEAALMEHPHAALRGWVPGETLEDLREENARIEAAAQELDWATPKPAIVTLLERIDALPPPEPAVS